MPKTRLQFSDGSILTVGTIACDDQIHQAVYLSFTSAGGAAPGMELELPPHAVDVLIAHLQKRANEARFINGASLMEYPEPYRERPLRARKPKPSKKKEKKPAPQDAPGDAPPQVG